MYVCMCVHTSLPSCYLWWWCPLLSLFERRASPVPLSKSRSSSAIGITSEARRGLELRCGALLFFSLLIFPCSSPDLSFRFPSFASSRPLCTNVTSSNQPEWPCVPNIPAVLPFVLFFHCEGVAALFPSNKKQYSQTVRSCPWYHAVCVPVLASVVECF